jgi:DNA gyrase subunit B
MWRRPTSRPRFSIPTASRESAFAFANTINTPDGGTHLTGLRTALTRLINDYARKQGLIKEKEENFTGDDTRQGMTAIISVKVVEPQFEGQNKLKLLNNEVRYHVETAVVEAMGRWMEENPRDARQHHREVSHGLPRA